MRTWRWDPATNTWTQLNTLAAPNATVGASIARINTGDTVLFGGVDPLGAALGETWTFDGAIWSQATPPGQTPPARAYAAMAPDGASGVILFGGYDATGQLLNDTWRFDGVRWKKLNTANSPAARAHHGMACDFQRSLLGKQGVLLAGGNASGTLTDIWRFDGNDWTLSAATNLGL